MREFFIKINAKLKQDDSLIGLKNLYWCVNLQKLYSGHNEYRLIYGKC